MGVLSNVLFAHPAYKINLSRPRGYKTFFVLNSTEHEISTAHKKLKYREMKKVFCFKYLKCCI